MQEFYTQTPDREEKLVQTVGCVLVTLIFCVVITIASGILG